MYKLSKILVCIALIALFCGFACAETLELPASLTVIRAEAFAGDTAIETVVVPEGVTSIESKAFANSGLSLIQLPGSLTSIAPDAFEGVSNFKAVAAEGTYAYTYCTENNIPMQDFTQATPVEHFKYREITRSENLGMEIYGCNSLLADVIVPEEIDGLPVFEMDYKYFQENTQLRSLYLPDSVMYIDTVKESGLTSINYPSRASAYFTGMESLESVVIRTTPDLGEKEYAYIHSEAFKDCINLKSIILPDEIKTIDQYAFQNCASLTEIRIPKKMTLMGMYAFDGCTSLRKIDGVYGTAGNLNSVDSGVFRNCKSLESLVLLGNVNYISNTAFEGCENLTLTVMPGSDALKKCESLGLKYVVADYGYEYNYQIEGSLIFTGYAGSEPEITVPAEAYGMPVSAVAYEAFKLNETVTSVTVAEGISEIRMYAFRECPNLKTVILPDSVTTMNSSVFYKSKAIEKVVLPSGLTAIPDNTFYECNALKEMKIPSGVTEIGKSAFGGCISMEEIILPDGLTIIKDGAFYNCASVEKFVIPKGVTSIGTTAFAYCAELESISLPNGLLTIGDSAFMECGELLSMYIPDSVTSIGKQCFQNCEKLRKIHLPANLTEIPYFCFWDCYELEYANIPEGVTAIGMSAFAYCNKLDEITLPASLVSVADNAFMSASNHDRKFAVLSQSADISYSEHCLWMTTENPVYCYQYTGAEVWAKACGYDVVYLDDNDFASVGSVSLPETMRIAAGKTDWVPLSIFPDLGDLDVMWISKNGNVATVSGGMITAEAPGTAEIMIIVGDKTASMTLTVYLELTSFDLSDTEITIEAGSTHQLSCTNIAPAGAEAVFTYESSNALAASVDANGRITANAIGDAVITVTSDSGVEQTCTVHVVRPA